MTQFAMFPDADQEPKPKKYPEAAGYAKRSRTSKAAAEAVFEFSENQQLVYDALKKRPMTDYEICADLDRPMNRVQPRRSELFAAKVIVDSGVTRPTPYGRQATVWKVAE